MSAVALSDELNPSRRAKPSRQDRLRGTLPYCFILDDGYRVIMAGPSGGGDPLGPLYDAGAGPDVLPDSIDEVVRDLTASWRSTATAAASASATVCGLQVTVAPLHGFEGRRIAVFVQRAVATG